VREKKEKEFRHTEWDKVEDGLKEQGIQGAS